CPAAFLVSRAVRLLLLPSFPTRRSSDLCVQACPTATLMENTIIEAGQPEHSVITTCAYCGVGCSFEAELQGSEVVRMTPYKGGKDRKSTRLNSSHVKISYAVFCLKKKNQ